MTDRLDIDAITDEQVEAGAKVLLARRIERIKRIVNGDISLKDDVDDYDNCRGDARACLTAALPPRDVGEDVRVVIKRLQNANVIVDAQHRPHWLQETIDEAAALLRLLSEADDERE